MERPAPERPYQTFSAQQLAANKVPSLEANSQVADNVRGGYTKVAISSQAGNRRLSWHAGKLLSLFRSPFFVPSSGKGRTALPP